jgi:general stress protein 26
VRTEIDRTKADIDRAWQKAQDAWVAAGKSTPCYEPLYMAARAELAAVVSHAVAAERARRRQRARTQ